MKPRVRYGGDAITVGGQARALAFAPSAPGAPPRLVALGNAHTLRYWDLPSPSPVRTISHAGLGSHAALAFVDRETALVHLDHEFARVHLRDGRVERIPGPERDNRFWRRETVFSPSARFALSMQTGSDYMGQQSLVRADVSGATVTETLLDAIPPNETLERLGVTSSRRDLVRSTFTGAAIRDDGSVIAIGQVNQAWALFAWSAAGAFSLTPLTREAYEIHSANPHIFFPNSLQLLPGNRALVCQGRMRVIDLATGDVVRSLDVVTPELEGGDTHVGGGALIDGGRRFVAATYSGVALFDVESGAVEKARRFDERAFILAAAASDDGKVFAAADDRGVLVHSIPDLAPLHSPSGHRNPPNVIALCPRGRHVATSDGRALKMWHLASGELRWDAALQVWASMVFSPDGERLFADAYLLEAATGAKLATPGVPGSAAAHSWSPEDGTLVHLDYSETTFRRKTGALLRFTEGEEMEVAGEAKEEYLRCVPVISENGKRAVVSSESVVLGYDVKKRKRLWREEYDVVRHELSPDGALVALTTIGGNDVTILDAKDGNRLGQVSTGRTGLLQVLAFGAGDRIAIPGDDEGMVRVLTFDRKKLVKAPASVDLAGGHGAKVCALRFGTDGTDLLSAAEDGSVCLWKL